MSDGAISQDEIDALLSGVDLGGMGPAAQTSSGAKKIDIDRVELEKWYSDVIPDVVVYAGGKQFFVEIYVTHAIDEGKLKKLQEKGIIKK